MASNSLIAFLFAIGFGGWVFSKAQRSTGGNTKNALVMAGGAAVVAFVILVIILGMIFHS